MVYVLGVLDNGPVSGPSSIETQSHPIVTITIMTVVYVAMSKCIICEKYFGTKTQAR
jgi:hypothetical protein